MRGEIDERFVAEGCFLRGAGGTEERILLERLEGEASEVPPADAVPAAARQSPNAAAQFRCLSKHAAMRTASLLASHIKDTAGDGIMVVQNWFTRGRRWRQFRGVAATLTVYQQRKYAVRVRNDLPL
jgi:hypothetical protein